MSNSTLLDMLNRQMLEVRNKIEKTENKEELVTLRGELEQLIQKKESLMEILLLLNRNPFK